ncbi:sodium:solute symporter [Asaia bogorensis]|uniref:sodium:solute symporter n=1 Tax=Asaia bogorensis TaxID=91915 RepID=UPI002863F825|nr:sodium:solute symporter [Asaia bogorensis]MDR6182895.1 SSS family solute:Na+ symporter [Asaia bogorensis NBRC 16594]
MHPLDRLVILLYFAGLCFLVWRVSRRSAGSSRDFLSAHHDLPWWALCLSLVATETSTLTFISIPGIGYTQGMVFLGIAGGYFIGRGLVALWFLPRYVEGSMTSAYTVLGARYGAPMQRLASGAFLVTRFMAESIRLLAGALPIVWLFTQSGLPVGRWSVLSAILVFTLFYTILGGLRAVVWSDAIQLGIYGFGAAFCVVYVWLGMAGHGASGPGAAGQGWSMAVQSGKLAVFHPLTAQNWLGDPFTLAASLFGGAVLSIASHGTDQLMVQRILAARSLREARMALIGSAVVVAALFGLLSLLGVQLWVARAGRSLAADHMMSSDALFPHFMIEALPAGIAGLLIAGVLSATMGSLSSTLNAMAGASLTDFGPGPRRWIEQAMHHIGYRPRPALCATLHDPFMGGCAACRGGAVHDGKQIGRCSGAYHRRVVLWADTGGVSLRAVFARPRGSGGHGGICRIPCGHGAGTDRWSVAWCRDCLFMACATGHPVSPWCRGAVSRFGGTARRSPRSCQSGAPT